MCVDDKFQSSLNSEQYTLWQWWKLKKTVTSSLGDVLIFHVQTCELQFKNKPDFYCLVGYNTSSFI